VEFGQANTGGRSKKLAVRFDGWFRLASHLKKSLNELMGWDGPMTHRQFAAWQWWLLEQWNQPSRSDHYAMQVAAVVDMSGEKDRDYRIKFKLPELASSSQETVEPVFLVDGKPFGPRRLTKEDIERMEQRNLVARLKAVKPPDRSKQTQQEMSRQIDEIIKHNEQSGRGGRCKITPNGIKPME
jgi:hypothetical protein